MWSRLYRDHVLMAFPTYDSAKHAWVPQVDIDWFLGTSRDSTFVRFPRRFLTEDEAVTCALARGQAWMDKRLERLQGRALVRRMFDMTDARDESVKKASVKQPRPTHAAPKPYAKQTFTFEEFESLLAQKGLTINVKTLQKSYAALVKLKKIKRWSWAEAKRKAMRAQHAPTPTGTQPRIPLSERAWGKIV